MRMIHETAIIGKDVQIGENVSIGAYAIVESGVSIGNNVEIQSHAVVRSGTIIHNNVTIDSFAAIGGNPQDLSFDKTRKSGVTVGEGTTIREHVTIHRATIENGATVIGSNCLLMACSHVGHDCTVGSDAVLANCSLLGGFASIGNHCFIGGGASVHQCVRIGEYAILGGYSATSMDLPPYTMAADRTGIVGFNLVGLRRAGFGREVIAELKKCFYEMYGGSGLFPERAKALIASGKFHSREAMKFLEFFTAFTRRGFAPLRKQMHKKNQSSGIASDFGSSM